MIDVLEEDVAPALDLEVVPRFLMGALAEFERGLIVERTQAGIQAAKKRGVHLGRLPSLASEQVDHALALIERGESPRAVARTMRVGKSTLYRALKDTGDRSTPHKAEGILRSIATGLSNGVLEAINGNVQAAKRKAKGYRTKRNLRAVIYLIAGDVLANSPT